MQLAQTVRRAARLEPNRIALVDGATRLDWCAFENRVARIASGLRALGVGEGDRVAMLAHNSGATSSSSSLWCGRGASPCQ